MTRRPWRAGWAGLLVLALGCGAGTPPTYKVTGTVTFDGQPVEDGEILFLPVEKELGPDAGRIRNGAYELRAKAGRKRVEIRAARPVPGQTNPMGPVYADYIPQQYNARSTLAADVQPDGPNRFDYKLIGGTPTTEAGHEAQRPTR
jgi:hypothetical protein